MLIIENTKRPADNPNIMYANIIGKFILEIPKLSGSRMMLEDINAINVPECSMGQN